MVEKKNMRPFPRNPGRNCSGTSVFTICHLEPKVCPTPPRFRIEKSTETLLSGNGRFDVCPQNPRRKKIVTEKVRRMEVEPTL